MINLISVALDFLRRGIINPKAEVTAFSKWCDGRIKDGEVIKYPERLLQSWRTTQEATVKPSEGALIADFVEAINCTDLEAICAITKVEVSNGLFVVWVASQECRKQLDAAACENKEKALQYIRAVGAKEIEYRELLASDYTDTILREVCGNIHKAQVVKHSETTDFTSGIPEEKLNLWVEETQQLKRRKLEEFELKARQLLSSLNCVSRQTVDWNRLKKAFHEKATYCANEAFCADVENYRKEVER